MHIIYHAPPFINTHVHHPAENPGPAIAFYVELGKGPDSPTYEYTDRAPIFRINLAEVYPNNWR